MDLQPIQNRLKTNASELMFVGGTADIPDGKMPAKLPAAFVHPLSDSAAPNSLVSGVDQRITVRFAVLLCVRDARPKMLQGRSLTQLDAVRESVRTALLNWQPAGASDVCTFAGGNLRDVGSGHLWWQDDYLTAHHWRAI